MSCGWAWCPSGYVPFEGIRKELCGWARSGRINPEFAEFVADGSFLKFPLGELLAQGSLWAVGVGLASGVVMTIRPEAWRRFHEPLSPGGQHYDHPIEAALDGVPIWVPVGQGEELCHAAVALSDLARFVDADPAPPEPGERPAGWPGGSALQQPGAEPPRGAGGRPPKHDWDAFWIEVIWFINGKEVDPGQRAQLQKHMASWTAERWLEPPDEATIRKRLAGLFGRRP